MKPVDRTSRDRVAAEVRRFLDGESTAFEFDEAIFDIESDDPTVDDIVQTLWFFYDDLVDHEVTLSKPAWDYFQRLLLILESDRHILSVNVIRRWRASQLVASIALAGFFLVVWQFGFGQHLLAFAMPFGVISMLITWRRRRVTMTVDDAFESLTPFSSVTEIRDTYRSVKSFRKSRYPEHLADRRIRSRAMESIMMIPNGIVWLMFSPVVLFFQMLPDRDSQTQVASDS